MASGDEKEWRVVTTDRSSHTGQWSQWSLVPGESDAGCWTADDVCLLAFTLSSPPPASARRVSLSTPDRETMQVPQF